MVSSLSIFFMGITLFLSLIMPVLVVFLLCLKRKISFIPVGVGALVFTVFQLLIRIPALQMLAQIPAFAAFLARPIAGGIFLGLTAGIFEEVGRYIGYKLLLRQKRAWKDGFAFGLGHGGIESIVLVGMTYINNIVLSLMLNNGQQAEKIISALPTGTWEQIYDALTQTAPHIFLVGGIERIFAMVIQVAFSILVLYTIRKKNIFYLVLAVLLHLVVDGPLALLRPHGLWVIEGFVCICAIAGLIYIVASRKTFQKLDEAEA